MEVPVRRAIVSVFDKTGLEVLAAVFKEFNIAVISTGDLGLTFLASCFVNDILTRKEGRHQRCAAFRWKSPMFLMSQSFLKCSVKTLLVETHLKAVA